MIDIKEKDKKLIGYSFIDLFAGIGGFHYALTSFGANCVFASEIDEKAAHIYNVNHKTEPFGDITKISETDIPNHDILCAGFPCQAFSISGKQKGFEDTRGTLFFDIARIVDHHKPKVLFLENVKNFIKHDGGNTLKTVVNVIVKMGYNVYYEVLNTSNFGLPQNRERVYIVAFRNDLNSSLFSFPSFIIKSKLTEILENNPEDGKVISREDISIDKDYIPQTNMFGKSEIPNKPIQIGKVNKGGQGERIYHPLGHAITLSAYGGGAGSKTGLYKIEDVIRKLSPRECARLQGFPESFIYPSSISEAHKQFGNSVSINVLQYITQEIINVLEYNEKENTTRFANGKTGIQKRKEIVSKFENWKNNLEARAWLLIMEYELTEIKSVKAVVISGFKTDVQVQITIHLAEAINVENLQVKLVSNLKGFNQIDKRWTDKYVEMWDIPNNITKLIKQYTGELLPSIDEPRDSRRMFIDELSKVSQNKLVN